MALDPKSILDMTAKLAEMWASIMELVKTLGEGGHHTRMRRTRNSAG
jgi:hypothetical protein